MFKKTLTAVGIILFIAAAGVSVYRATNNKDQSKNLTSDIALSSKNRSTIRLIATGDIIAHDSINETALQPDGSYNYLPVMANMQQFFDASDIKFCNQATPAGGKAFGVSGYPVFNAPFALTTDLVKLGCNLVNIGTNHTNDGGQKLIDSLVTNWNKQDILAHAGANRNTAEQSKVRYFTNRDVKFAFVSYTTYSNAPATEFGINLYNKAFATRQINEAKLKADIVIVSMRWGNEYSDGISETQHRISQELADLGVDIVLGHGPHVLEPAKRLTGKNGTETLVWYSLGNFTHSQLSAQTRFNGIAIMDIDPQAKKIVNTGFLPIYMHYEWTPEQKAADDLAARKNFAMYSLDNAAEPLLRSQLQTTVDEQKTRIETTLNRFTDILIWDEKQFFIID